MWQQRVGPCVGLRTVPIAEAMMALVLMDHTASAWPKQRGITARHLILTVLNRRYVKALRTATLGFHGALIWGAVDIVGVSADALRYVWLNI